MPATTRRGSCIAACRALPIGGMASPLSGHERRTAVDARELDQPLQSSFDIVAFVTSPTRAHASALGLSGRDGGRMRRRLGRGLFFLDACYELLQRQERVVTFPPNFLSLQVIPYAFKDVLHVFVHR